MIFTTIQAQDFQDVEGDAAIGRRTFPIYAPEFSRVFTLCAMMVWSLFVAWYWDIGYISSLVMAVIGTYVGARYYFLRAPRDDRQSYIIFNVSGHIFCNMTP